MLIKLSLLDVRLFESNLFAEQYKLKARLHAPNGK